MIYKLFLFHFQTVLMNYFMDPIMECKKTINYHLAPFFISIYKYTLWLIDNNSLKCQKNFSKICKEKGNFEDFFPWDLQQICSLYSSDVKSGVRTLTVVGEGGEANIVL